MSVVGMISFDHVMCDIIILFVGKERCCQFNTGLNLVLLTSSHCDTTTTSKTTSQMQVSEKDTLNTSLFEELELTLENQTTQ